MSKICSYHNTEADWKEGISKKTGKGYAFWSCTQKMQDGSYCNNEIIDGQGVNPKTVAEFDNSLKDDRSRRIERQHSQEMAIRFLEMLVHTGQITEVTKELVNLYTIHFQKDLEN